MSLAVFLRIVEHKFATLTRDVVSALGDSEGDDLNILRRNLAQSGNLAVRDVSHVYLALSRSSMT